MNRERFTRPANKTEKSTTGKESESEWSADEALQFAQKVYAEEINNLTKILNVGYFANVVLAGLVISSAYNMTVNHAGMDVQQKLPFLLSLTGMNASSYLNILLKRILRRKQDNLDKMKVN